jgi:predicted phosphohydrolase
METFKFQLYSDIHLEFNKSYPEIPPFEENLILAGDIGKINTLNFKPFFDYCSSKWKKVFYVLGNHEYYHSKKTMFNLNNEYKEFFKNYDNIFLLDNSSYEFSDKLRIVGSTLWSNPTKYKGLNDFNYILEFNDHINKTLGITVDKFRSLHEQAVKYLFNEINKKDKNLIIITHFPPSQNKTSHPKYDYQEQYLKDYFASNIIDNIKDKNHKIKGWIYGHTHYSNSIFNYINGIQLLSNQMGYPKELDTSLISNGSFELNLF